MRCLEEPCRLRGNDLVFLEAWFSVIDWSGESVYGVCVYRVVENAKE